MLLCAILGGSGPFLWASRPRIIDARACARECRRLLDTGEVKNAAELALGHRVTPAHVSRLMSLLRLTREILEYIGGLDGTEDGPHHRPPPVAQRLGCGMCGAGVDCLNTRRLLAPLRLHTTCGIRSAVLYPRSGDLIQRIQSPTSPVRFKTGNRGKRGE